MSSTDGHLTPSNEAIVELNGVGKSFTVNGRSLTVFDDLNYRIGKGSFLSVVGPSGCGKSTLLKLISGLEQPTRGEIVFRGKRLSGPPQGMIYVFQQYTKSIFPWKTVIQNIAFGLTSAHKGLSKKEIRERCMEYVRLVGLEGYENHYPAHLSGGMQQRVVIARALICEPDVLLMDEPFSAVDAMTRAILQELILSIWERLKLSIVFVTHDVEEAVFLSSNIVSLGKAPAGIREDLEIPLSYPRDRVATPDDERFGALRHRLFQSIFDQEKSDVAAL
jgi:NitT/TauT family transport system ATP-binding protein